MESAPPLRAWQPLTFGGVAGFADGSLSRLWLVQLITALLVAGSVIWFLVAGWFPFVEQAIGSLPDQAAIRGRQLEWSVRAPREALAENQFLSIRVEPEGSFPVDQSADLRLILAGNELKIQSLLGFLV